MTIVATNKVKHVSKNPLMRWSIHQFHDRVRTLLPSDVAQVLEVGCGEGFSAQAVLTDRPQITSYGGDLSFEAVIEARIRFPAMRYGVIDATRLPYRDKSVDLIFSLEVLEHLPQPDVAIREFKRVSRRYLLLSVPNEPIFRGLRMASLKGLRQFGDHPEHVNHWSLFGFKRFLQTQGLRIAQPSSPFPFAWSIVLCEID